MTDAPGGDSPSSTRKAAEPAAARAPFHLSVAGCTDVGKVRRKNEDAFVVANLSDGTGLDGAPQVRFDVRERGVLLAVSDGMGGAAAGEVASALVVETLTQAMATAPPNTPTEALMNEAVQKAHRAVWETAERGSKRMGATLTAVFVHAGQAHIAEVGDSRAYLIRTGKMCQLTHDQSIVQLLVDTGVIEPEQAETSPIRNIILQAMGNQPDIKLALARVDLRDGDRLVLCSDGLTTMVRDDEIRDVVLGSERPEIGALELVELANRRGGLDNITVIVADVGGDLSAPSAGEAIQDTFKVLSSFAPPGMPPETPQGTP